MLELKTLRKLATLTRKAADELRSQRDPIEAEALVGMIVERFTPEEMQALALEALRRRVLDVLRTPEHEVAPIQTGARS